MLNYNFECSSQVSPFFFFLMIRHPPKSTLFPHTPLFRSLASCSSAAGMPLYVACILCVPFHVVKNAGDDPLGPVRTLGLYGQAIHHLRIAVYLVTLVQPQDRKSTRLNSSHDQISYAVFCL